MWNCQAEGVVGTRLGLITIQFDHSMDSITDLSAIQRQDRLTPMTFTVRSLKQFLCLVFQRQGGKQKSNQDQDS